MAHSSPNSSETDSPKGRLGRIRIFRQKLHGNCDEIKWIAIEVATTVVFLYWLVRAVLHELGL